MLEFEKRIIIDSDEYGLICERLGSGRRLVWTNYYYDTEALDFRRAGFALRVRECGDSFESAVERSGGSAGRICVRYLAKGADRFRAAEALGTGVRFCGSLRAERMSYPFGKRARLYVDRNCYLGAVDYELAVQYRRGYEKECGAALCAAAAALERALSGFDPSRFLLRADSSAGKSERFFERWLEGGGWELWSAPDGRQGGMRRRMS